MSPRVSPSLASSLTLALFLAIAAFGAVADEPPKTAPSIVNTTPSIGAASVSPDTTEIRVTFDQDMGKGMSWTGGGEVFPEVTDKPKWVDDRTCVLPVKLEAGNFYRVGINSTSHRNFRGANGIPAAHSVIYFVTEGADAETLNKLARPQIASLNPPANAKNVSSDLKQISVTFDRPMNGGRSWAGRPPQTPEFHEPEWNDDMTTCTVKVTLEPDRVYTIRLNASHAINFQSKPGVPMEPFVWTFSTE